jgi:hypothetical protein
MQMQQQQQALLDLASYNCMQDAGGSVLPSPVSSSE